MTTITTITIHYHYHILPDITTNHINYHYHSLLSSIIAYSIIANNKFRSRWALLLNPAARGFNPESPKKNPNIRIQILLELSEAMEYRIRILSMYIRHGGLGGRSCYTFFVSYRG
jgi:hypothetical protein